MYQRVSTSMENREEKMANAADLIERDLVLLGVTAIEDKLQHGVSIVVLIMVAACLINQYEFRFQRLSQLCWTPASASGS